MSEPIIISGHQPAYLPWLGYLHKLLICDVFVFMDDVQFIERGFIHRNRIKVASDRDFMLTIPIEKKYKSLPICDIRISNDEWQKKHWQTIDNTYKNCRFYSAYAEQLAVFYAKSVGNLSDYLYEMLLWLADIIGADCKIVREKSLSFKQKKSDLLLEQALYFQAKIMFTGAMGKDYVSLEDFTKQKILVEHQDYHHPVYQQKYAGFLPSMSVLDLIFNESSDRIVDLIMKDNLTKVDLRKKYAEHFRNS